MRAILLAIAGLLLIAAWPHSVEAQNLSSSTPTAPTKTKSSSALPGDSGATGAMPQFQYQGRPATLDQFDSILSNACDGAYSQGHQLSVSWQQTFLTSGKTPIVQGLLNFRHAASVCLQQIGALINATAKDVPDITSKIAGTWVFSANLWQSTNQFMLAVGAIPAQPSPGTPSKPSTGTPPPSPTQIVASISPQSEKFSTALDQFSKWIADTKERVADIRRQDLTAQKSN